MLCIEGVVEWDKKPCTQGCIPAGNFAKAQTTTSTRGLQWGFPSLTAPCGKSPWKQIS